MLDFIDGEKLKLIGLLFWEFNVNLVKWIGLVKIMDNCGGDDINIVLFFGMDVFNDVWV